VAFGAAVAAEAAASGSAAFGAGDRRVDACLVAGFRAAGLRGWAGFAAAPAPASCADVDGEDVIPEVRESSCTAVSFWVFLPGSGSTAPPYQDAAPPWLKASFPLQIGHKNL
jgi:hypothetical protein